MVYQLPRGSDMFHVPQVDGVDLPTSHNLTFECYIVDQTLKDSMCMSRKSQTSELWNKTYDIKLILV